MSVGSITAEIARRICDEQPVGYSQPDRRTWYANADAHGRVKSPQNADCSSLACGSVNYGLHHTYRVPWGHQALLEINDFWTGNMRSGMEARGFEEPNWPNENMCPDGGFRKGDIILSAANEGGVGHVVVAVEDSTDPLISEAWIAEDGSIDGWVGDQTGSETRTVRYSTHPHTQRAAWTSCHRFDEGLFFQQWPEFAKGKPAAQSAPAPAASSTPAHAHGIDVSSHQAGLNIAAIWCDFVIVKVTEGTGYENPFWRQQAEATLHAGKRLGLYHFANDDDAGSQARYFLDRAKRYAGRATFWLDWESTAVPTGPGPALAFLNQVAAETGSTPGFYTYQNVLSSYDWSQVAARYPLWVAGGPEYSDYGRAYSDPPVPSVPYWGGGALVHQYTEDGRLPGYSGTLDLNRCRDRAALDRMIGGGSASGAPAPQDTSGEPQLVVDGEWGPATVGRLKSVMGAVGYDETFAVANLRRFLNKVVPAASQQTLTGSPRLPEDRGWDSAAVKVFQYLVLAWQKPGVPSGWSFGDWVDGDFGEATIKALQLALNASKAGSFRLW